MHRANNNCIGIMERIFRRKLYERLLEWKRVSNGKTAIMVEGARRVGKSTLVELFAWSFGNIVQGDTVAIEPSK